MTALTRRFRWLRRGRWPLLTLLFTMAASSCSDGEVFEVRLDAGHRHGGDDDDHLDGGTRKKPTTPTRRGDGGVGKSSSRDGGRTTQPDTEPTGDTEPPSGDGTREPPPSNPSTATPNPREPSGEEDAGVIEIPAAGAIPLPVEHCPRGLVCADLGLGESAPDALCVPPNGPPPRCPSSGNCAELGLPSASCSMMTVGGQSFSYCQQSCILSDDSAGTGTRDAGTRPPADAGHPLGRDGGATATSGGRRAGSSSTAMSEMSDPNDAI